MYLKEQLDHYQRGIWFVSASSYTSHVANTASDAAATTSNAVKRREGRLRLLSNIKSSAKFASLTMRRRYWREVIDWPRISRRSSCAIGSSPRSNWRGGKELMLFFKLSKISSIICRAEATSWIVAAPFHRLPNGPTAVCGASIVLLFMICRLKRLTVSSIVSSSPAAFVGGSSSLMVTKLQ
ncbi:hypothetical protein BT63DRAFT_22808 [Microthyrium microscopicum]|uniref:Uncharacterized protein n=1 Tax=Microthyrium microscopicum TaxID=703497 RepID=A0A6A6UUX9_9PEZI|nr:hypothetical protein BT63DRAFT_22808 [Microthyrium microscopicum]